MGRAVGSLNGQRPFADPLRVEICAGNDPRHLRALSRKLLERALDGDLSAIREIADRLDGKPAQAIERGDVSVEVLSDRELVAIIREGHSFSRSTSVSSGRISASTALSRNAAAYCCSPKPRSHFSMSMSHLQGGDVDRQSKQNCAA